MAAVSELQACFANRALGMSLEIGLRSSPHTIRQYFRDVTRRIREQEREGAWHIPIVALTAHAAERDRHACMSAAMDDFLSKPYSQNALMAVLGRWLSV